MMALSVTGSTEGLISGIGGSVNVVKDHERTLYWSG